MSLKCLFLFLKTCSIPWGESKSLDRNYFSSHCQLLIFCPECAHCQVKFHVIYNRLNLLTFMQSDTVRWWCCTNSAPDKVLPSFSDRHLTYSPTLPPQHLYMIIWYFHSFYTRCQSIWFEWVWLLLFSGCVFTRPLRKLLINDCEGFLLAVLSQRWLLLQLL